MRQQRRQYSADWKAKVVLEAVKAQRTVQQIASHYEVHPSMVAQWKRQLLEGAAGIFSDGTKRAAEADEALKVELYSRSGSCRWKWTGSKKVGAVALEERRGWIEANDGALVKNLVSRSMTTPQFQTGTERWH